MEVLKTTKTTKERVKDYLWIIIMCFIMIIFGFCVSGFAETFRGFVALTFSTDHLFTDYFVQGSIGGAFFNAGLMGLLGIALILICKKDINGITIAGIFFFIGFAMFGKTIINTPPIIGGVFLYSLLRKERFKDLIPTAYMGCTMAPAVSEIYYYKALTPTAGVFLGIALGLFLGFVLPAVAKVAFNFHNGFNLYNVGFTGGIILTVVVSVLKIFDFQVTRELLWYTGDDKFLLWFMIVFFCYLALYGIIHSFLHDNDYQCG